MAVHTSHRANRIAGGVDRRQCPPLELGLGGELAALACQVGLLRIGLRAHGGWPCPFDNLTERRIVHLDGQ